jgi:3D (Asp-Asp-Asp) domain-containing protein
VETGAGRIGWLAATLAAGALAAVLLPAPVGADIAPTLRARVHAARVEGDRLAQRERAALLRLYAAQTRLARAREAVDVSTARAAAATRQRAAVVRQITAVQRSLRAARRRLARTLRLLYQHGQPDAMAIILGATSVDDAVDELDRIKRATRLNRRLVATLATLDRRLRVLEARLAERGRRLTRLRAAATANRAALERSARMRLDTVVSVRDKRRLTRRQVAQLEALARRAQRRAEQLTEKPAALSTAAAPAAPRPAPALAPGATRTLVVDAVAYHLPGRTASGLPVGKGVVAVDPSVIPLGTRMSVPGYGSAVAADVGSAIRGNVIDLWMPSRAKALAWGRRTVTITLYG